MAERPESAAGRRAQEPRDKKTHSGGKPEWENANRATRSAYSRAAEADSGATSTSRVWPSSVVMRVTWG